MLPVVKEMRARKLRSMKTLGERFEAALSHAGRSRKELAAAMGVTVQAVGQTIRGESNVIEAARAARAARFLGVDYFWLATGEGNMLETFGLSRQALQIARQFDTITDPDLRQRAFVICNGTTLSMGGIAMPPPDAPSLEVPPPPAEPRATRTPAAAKRTRI